MNVNQLTRQAATVKRILTEEFKTVQVSEVTEGDVIVHAQSEYDFRTSKVHTILPAADIDGTNLYVSFYRLDGSHIVKRDLTKEILIKK